MQYTVQLWRHIDTLYARAGHLSKSAETLRYAIKAQPDDLTLRLALVRRYIENQNWRSAKAAVLRLLEIVPKHPEALMLHAQILDAGGDLDEMIGNLVENAAKYGGGRVFVTVEPKDGIIDIVIEDDGKGIPKPQRETLFQRGARLDTDKPGTGLGLAIVRDVAEIYGGTITLEESEDLGGMLARLSLPAG